MKENNAPKTIRREEYLPPDYLINRVALTFDLVSNATEVEGTYQCTRQSGVANDAAFVLDGVGLELLRVQIDGKDVPHENKIVDENSLTLLGLPQHFDLTLKTRIDPINNTALEGLYQTSGNFCTQCEAQGFRKIIYYPDRPDVLAIFEVTLVADKARYPVLLANGNLVEEGNLDNGRHFAKWHDPFPKPAYLFALVAGQLDYISDQFVTRSGREIDLRIYVESHNLNYCDYAMISLKKSMQWDEDVYGLEYDLDIYMIVAVDDFNMGAMENKGLNIFNSKYVLADRETATDADFMGIEAVVAHEYFHNWSGNRVTCKDWFQLSLKEGLTVFRDQEFSADMNSRAVKRIADVRLLRARQFPEDAGPMAHPIRPDSYIEINNFYTVTIYEKGAEVIHMLHTLLGSRNYRKGTDLYFERHDGKAATCDDFVDAMQEASGIDLTQFRHWYSEAGTPVVDATLVYDEAQKICTLTLQQRCPATPGQPDKPNFHIPVRLALLNQSGEPVHLKTTHPAFSGETEVVVDLTESSQSLVFSDISEKPVPSLLRGFSAPVQLHYDYTDQELAFLMANDSDTFNRWESGQRLARLVVEKGMATDRPASFDSPASATDSESAWLTAIGKMLNDDSLEPALRAEMLSVPSIEGVAELHDTIDIDAIHASRSSLLRHLADTHENLLIDLFESMQERGEFSVDAKAIGQRSLKNACLSVLANSSSSVWLPLAVKQYETAISMTDQAAALRILSDHQVPERDACFGDFYNRWKGNKLVIDKWFTLQAISCADDTLERVENLAHHPAYTWSNPNRVRSLVGAFAMSNTLNFHHRSGGGYRFLADSVLKLDPENPQVSARLVGALSRWMSFDRDRQELMRQELRRIQATSPLSPDVFEIVAKCLEVPAPQAIS